MRETANDALRCHKRRIKYFGVEVLLGDQRIREFHYENYRLMEFRFYLSFHGLNARSPLAQRNTDWLEGRISAACGNAVLIADDSESDIFFLLRAFSASHIKNPVYVVRSGAEAIQYLNGAGKFANRAAFPLPKMVFLDLKMPTPDGYDVLWWKTQHLAQDRILWVAMSNFDTAKTINQAYACGATTFLSKPLGSDDVRHLIVSFEEFWKIRSGDELADSNFRLTSRT